MVTKTFMASTFLPKPQKWSKLRCFNNSFIFCHTWIKLAISTLIEILLPANNAYPYYIHSDSLGISGLIEFLNFKNIWHFEIYHLDLCNACHFHLLKNVIFFRFFRLKNIKSIAKVLQFVHIYCAS